MAIRDKITIRMKSGGKPHVSQVERPGGTVSAEMIPGTSMLQVRRLTRKGEVVDWIAFTADEIRSIEFERGA